MRQFYVAVAAIGGLFLLLGLVSNLVKSRLWVAAPLVALVIGVALGSHGLRLFDIFVWGPHEPILEQASLLTLAVRLMGMALRLPDGYPLRPWRPLVVLLWLAIPWEGWLALGWRRPAPDRRGAAAPAPLAVGAARPARSGAPAARRGVCGLVRPDRHLGAL